jgi:hypothetical protein
MDLDILRAVDASHQRVFVAESTVPDSGEGLFTCCARRAGEVLGWYNGNIMFRSMGSREGGFNDGDLLVVTRERYQKYALQIDATGHGWKGPKISNIFVVPQSFCAFAKMNDPRYCSCKDRASRASVSAMRRANVQFDVTRDAASIEDITDPYFVSATATRDIEAGEELFVDYGPQFAHWAPENK